MQIVEGIRTRLAQSYPELAQFFRLSSVSIDAFAPHLENKFRGYWTRANTF